MVSYKRIIAKLFREFKIFNAELIPDTIEWVAEAAEAIGYFGQTKTITGKEITIVDHKGELPCDIIKLNGVTIDGYYVPYGTGKFNYSEKAIDATIPSATLKESFKIEPGYILTKTKDTTLYLDYEAYHRDEDGLPMIPDIYQYKDAITKYILMKLIMLGYKHPVLDYRTAKDEWESASLTAHNKGYLPDAPVMQAFINNWVRLVPHINSELQFGEFLNDKETWGYE
jgi:hypothetical protein